MSKKIVYIGAVPAKLKGRGMDKDVVPGQTIEVPAHVWNMGMNERQCPICSRGHNIEAKTCRVCRDDKGKPVNLKTEILTKNRDFVLKDNYRLRKKKSKLKKQSESD